VDFFVHPVVLRPLIVIAKEDGWDAYEYLFCGVSFSEPILVLILIILAARRCKPKGNESNSGNQPQ
jgi:hypothetical protein